MKIANFKLIFILQIFQSKFSSHNTYIKCFNGIKYNIDMKIESSVKKRSLPKPYSKKWISDAGLKI